VQITRKCHPHRRRRRLPVQFRVSQFRVEKPKKKNRKENIGKKPAAKTFLVRRIKTWKIMKICI